MAIFGPKQWVNPFGKISIFRLFELLVFMAQKIVFFFQNIVKHVFLAYIAEKKVGEIVIFRPKPWVNPYGKISIFRLVQLLVFIAQRDGFTFQNIVKHIFLAQIAEKKKLKKWLFLDQNHGLNPWEKSQFFDFLNFLFLQARKAFFCSRIS